MRFKSVVAMSAVRRVRIAHRLTADRRCAMRTLQKGHRLSKYDFPLHSHRANPHPRPLSRTSGRGEAFAYLPPQTRGKGQGWGTASSRWVLTFLCLLVNPVISADYPTRPIRLIVPQSPGGTTDYTARLIGPRLAERLGQGVVVDNRPGAGSLLGIDLAAKAAPDGYTMLLAATTLGIMPAMVKQLPFDPVKDFAPITTLAVYPNLIVVHPSVQATSIKELIALAKAQPGKLNFASGGSGTGTQLTAELFKSMAGIDIVHVIGRAHV